MTIMTNPPTKDITAVMSESRSCPPFGIDGHAAGAAADGGGASSSTSRNASAARPARWPASSGTTCAKRSASITGSTTIPHDLTPASLTVMRFSEWINPETSNLEWLIRKDGCMHCEDPGCLKACPAPGAIVQYSNGIVDFVHENCIGCGYCIKGCPFNIPRISKVDHKAYKCTLCSDRVAVGQGPACAKACPTHAIVFGTKDEMKAHAEKRIEDLKSRGFANAGLYDPPGVGGTHVMYVLHHADKPEIYAGLAQRSEDQPGRRAVEGRHQICRPDGDCRLRGGRLPASPRQRPQPGVARG